MTHLAGEGGSTNYHLKRTSPDIFHFVEFWKLYSYSVMRFQMPKKKDSAEFDAYSTRYRVPRMMLSGLTPEQIGETLGLSPSSINKFYRGYLVLTSRGYDALYSGVKVIVGDEVRGKRPTMVPHAKTLKELEVGDRILTAITDPKNRERYAWTDVLGKARLKTEKGHLKPLGLLLAEAREQSATARPYQQVSV